VQISTAAVAGKAGAPSASGKHPIVIASAPLSDRSSAIRQQTTGAEMTRAKNTGTHLIAVLYFLFGCFLSFTVPAFGKVYANLYGDNWRPEQNPLIAPFFLATPGVGAGFWRLRAPALPDGSLAVAPGPQAHPYWRVDHFLHARIACVGLAIWVYFLPHMGMHAPAAHLEVVDMTAQSTRFPASISPSAPLKACYCHLKHDRMA
jgi:hypothetical protein